MKARKSLPLYLSNVPVVLLVFGGSMISPSPAHAAEYTAEAIVPQPDVWGYIQQNPPVRNLFGQQITGQYKSLTIVGDSYADWGNTLKAAGVTPPPTYPTARLSNGLSMGDALEYHYDLPTSSVANYAVGGAASGTANAFNSLFAAGYTLPGTTTEIQTLLATGRRFGMNDLVDLTTAGGNDGLLLVINNPGATTAQIAAAATQTSENIQSDVQQLVGDGARNVAILSPGDLSLLPAYAGNAELHSFYSTAFQMNEAALAPIARSGVRVFFFNLAPLEQRILANPGLYGFTNVTQACLSVSSCFNGTVAQQDQYFSWDGEHLTTAGYALVSRYEANQIDAPSTISAQSALGLVGARAFSDSVFARLDDDRFVDGSQTGGNGGSPLSVYLQGTEVSGSQDDQLFALGMHYSAPGVTVGVDDHVNPNLLLGLAFNYSSPQGSLNQGFGTVKMNTEQLALYGSWSNAGYFIDFSGMAGHNNYTITRPGVLNSIGGKTNGPDVVIAAKVGDLLLGTGAVRVGPIFGLDYAMVHESGYTESGDWLLSQVVGAQTLNSFIGSAGVQLRVSGTVRDTVVNAYLNMTADHEFLNPARDIITSQLSTPEIVVATPVAGTGTQTYGQIAAGLSVKVAKNLSVNGSLGTQFGGSAGAPSFGVEGGLSYRF